MAATATTLDEDRPAGPTTPEPAVTTVPAEVRRRLSSRLPGDGASGWWWAGLVGVIAAVLRLVSLAYPDKIIFDEVYYANEAETMLEHGSAWNHEKDEPKFVVHPPLGKWLIALGILVSRGLRGLSGPVSESAFDWRIGAVAAGVASVVILVRVARRLFGSSVLGGVAGLLLALDGMHFVSSRTALLDIFLMMFVLAAFACLLVDRDTRRERWLAALERGHDPARRLGLGFPWWRLAAALLAGCALSVKWSAAWYIALLMVLLVVWDFSTQRAAGVPQAVRWGDRLLPTLSWPFLFGSITVVTYVASWAGWFADDKAMFRHWLADQGRAEPPVFGALRNLFEYHMQAYGFHTTLHAEHQYQSWPWQWLLLGRPVAYYWSDAGPCGGEKCAAEILLLGTPLLWWTFIPALLGVLWYALSRRDWRAWTVLATAATGILPWVPYQFDNRTMFYFYALPSLPFLVLAVTMVLGWLAGPSPPVPARGPALHRDVTASRRTFGSIGMAAYVAAVAVCFAYFYPIYVGETLTYQAWHDRMWLGSLWI